LLEADSILMVCNRSQEQAFAAFGRALGISGFPSLDNEGDTLSLRDAHGAVVHAVAYSAAWYGGNWKSGGGWSLELIDHRLPCLEAGNWGASIDPAGGTPGRKNSIEGVRTDSIPPVLLRTYMRDSITLTAVFSKTLDSISASDTSLYTMTAGIGKPLRAVPLPPLFREVDLLLPQALPTGTVYLLQLASPRDCTGNRDPAMQEAKAGRAAPPAPGTICINEILFNPKPAGSDFVELFHRGDTPVDLSALFLANLNDLGQIASLQPCTDRHWFLYPGEYVVLTADSTAVLRDYQVALPSRVLEPGQLPSYPDDEGTVVVTDIRGTPIDICAYSEKMQYPLLSGTDGVALERIDPDAPSSDPANWFSAPASRGYATPTAQNGQFRKTPATGTMILAEPRVFSPDMDGFDDQLTVHYRFPAPGYACTITVFDEALRPVRRLVRNQSCGVEGLFRWDGLGDRQQRMPAGLYYIVSECFNLQGGKVNYRQAIALAYRQ
jgi:hypothetical protein